MRKLNHAEANNLPKAREVDIRVPVLEPRSPEPVCINMLTLTMGRCVNNNNYPDCGDKDTNPRTISSMAWYS